MNEHVYVGKCTKPGCKAPGDIAADSYTLARLGVVEARGKVCHGCLKGVEVGKRQLSSNLQTGGDARRLQLGGEPGKFEAGGEVRIMRPELDEAPELLTVEDGDSEEGEEVAEEEAEDLLEVYGEDCWVEEVVQNVATKMGQVERNIGVKVNRLQGQVEVTKVLFRDLEREMEDIQQLLYAEVQVLLRNIPYIQLICPGEPRGDYYSARVAIGRLWKRCQGDSEIELH